ncbi:MAG: hypothetical protein IT322_16135 [Anaerolineae bacterium]|nr:hypothetical protein [Anaerolineae bacterium]
MRIQYAPPGYDPLKDDLPMEPPKISAWMLMAGVVIAAFFILGAVSSARRAEAEEPLPTVADLPTSPPTATTTFTPVATWTPYPTYTLVASQTPYPTYTPMVSPTMLPTVTPSSSPGFRGEPPARVMDEDTEVVIATWTPGPWMLTKFAGGDK